jgi:hypothetical protein
MMIKGEREAPNLNSDDSEIGHELDEFSQIQKKVCENSSNSCPILEENTQNIVKNTN